MKTCTKCLQTKSLSEFCKNSRSSDGLFHRCKSCEKIRKRSQYERRWDELKDRRDKNKDAIKIANAGYHAKNIQKQHERSRLWRLKNTEHLREKAKRLYHTSTNRRLRTLIGGRIWQGLRDNPGANSRLISKKASTLSLLGCSFMELKEKLMQQMPVGMNWDDVLQGRVHIDHIIPCSAFDLSKEDHQRACFHFSNLQPLWKQDNWKKNDSLPTDGFDVEEYVRNFLRKN